MSRFSKQYLSKRSSNRGSQVAGSATASHYEPFLSQTEGAGEILRFNKAWAKKCAEDDTFAAFVTLFDNGHVVVFRQLSEYGTLYYGS